MGSVESLLWMILTLVVYVEAACPRKASEAESRTKECLTSLGLGIEPSSDGGKSGDPDQLKQFCQDGTIRLALECVENTVKECEEENEDVGSSLAKTVSTHNLRSGFEYMCEHVDILLEHSECVEDQTHLISKCISLETKLFKSKMQERYQRGQAGADDTSIWELSCGFMEKVLHCQETYYRENCGEDVTNVLTTFMQSVKPPICAQFNSAIQISLSKSFVVLLFVFTITIQRTDI